MTQLGVGIPHQVAELDPSWYDLVLKTLNPPYFHNWLFDLIGTYYTCTPTIYDDHIGRLVRAAEQAKKWPDREWYYLNEPERPEQANVSPLDAANTLRVWWNMTAPHNIKTWAAGVNVTVHSDDQAYHWMNEFITHLSTEEKERIHGWHIHIYGDATDFAQGVFNFREWMTDVALWKPVRVTECGIDEGCDKLMLAARRMLEEKLLERVYYFSVNYPTWPDNDLMNADGSLTPCGDEYVKVNGSELPQTTITHLPVIMA